MDTNSVRVLTKEASQTKEVVATFRLTQNSLDAIKWLTKKLDISTKQLFNSVWERKDPLFIKFLKKSLIDKNSDRIKKSQRVSRKCIENLNTIAKNNGI